ncbi:MAG TPA: hypothetical protein GX511_01070 [Firmicutes bacterium]|nr:hypothetical protein [Bacillota bacterium]
MRSERERHKSVKNDNGDEDARTEGIFEEELQDGKNVKACGAHRRPGREKKKAAPKTRKPG